MSGAILVAATTIAFRGATLIDGTGAPPVSNSLLVVSDGRIVSVGIATLEALAKLPPGTQVITGDNRWLVPGLIDAHVHAETDQDLKTMLNWGITTVRLMAEDTASAETLAKASATRTDIPEVVPAAPIFTTKGGWWDQGEPPDSHLNRFPAIPAQARELNSASGILKGCQSAQARIDGSPASGTSLASRKGRCIVCGPV